MIPNNVWDLQKLYQFSIFNSVDGVVAQNVLGIARYRI